jgi:quercetin dioxygenase-like cupin family protein
VEHSTEGWTFANSAAIEWNELGPGIAMKMLGGADGRVIAMFRFEPGYVGGVHDHTDAEFTYVLDGSIVSNGVLMEAGHAYAVGEGTTHSEFRTDTGCTLVSVFPMPA